MSQTPLRLLATILLLPAVLLGTAPAVIAAPADDTWTALAALPERLDSPLFALAVNPASSRELLLGTPSGNLYRSADGGATWSPAHRGLGRGVTTVAFDPFRPSLELAGTRGAGVWLSADGGQTWKPQPGTEQRTVRAFGFAPGLVLAGSDQGVLALHDASGGAWAAAGLAQVAVSAMVIAATESPIRTVVGGDTTRGSEPLPLFDSGDTGKSWSAVAGAAGGSSMVSALAAGPIPVMGQPQPMLMGTNIGLFESADGGTTWSAVTGGGSLPATDFTGAAFNANHTQRFYAASDGGGSDRGGLWATTDGGAGFTSLRPPVPAVTALAVSADQSPWLYLATFEPLDHTVQLWSYHDTGGAPHGPAAGAPKPAAAGGAAPASPHTPRAALRFQDWLRLLTAGPEAPYLALGAAAVFVLLLALVSYLRRTRGI